MRQTCNKKQSRKLNCTTDARVSHISYRIYDYEKIHKVLFKISDSDTINFYDLFGN